MAEEGRFPRLASMTADQFLGHVSLVAPGIPFAHGSPSRMAAPALVGGRPVGNRWVIQPMEGWDAGRDGRPTERTIRRWRRFGSSGAKMIWGGEAAAVREDGRANPCQLRIGEDTLDSLKDLLTELKGAHEAKHGRTDDLLVGLQLTHSGRFSVPREWGRREPRIAFRHPLLDPRVAATERDLLSDDEIGAIADEFVMAATFASQIGFDFVDIKHCHGYLGHELLAARERKGPFGGDLAHRMFFLRRIVEGIRTRCPHLLIGVRISAFDAIPFEKGPNGVGQPVAWDRGRPYLFGFGVQADDPVEMDLSEAKLLLSAMEDMGVSMVNVSGGSPYYTPHLLRPALYPPVDGYGPPEDPLKGVERHILATRFLKEHAHKAMIVGSGYTYLQEFLPQVGEGVLKRGWADFIGIGRMALSYPEMPSDSLDGRPLDRKRICRTFSECTTAPRKSLPSGCYPLDEFYRECPEASLLKGMKGQPA